MLSFKIKERRDSNMSYSRMTFIIREFWNGKEIKGSRYFGKYYTRDFAVNLAKRLFHQKRPTLTERQEAFILDEPYVSKPSYQVWVIYEDPEWDRERNGTVIAAWDSEYGRNGRRLTTEEKNRLRNYHDPPISEAEMAEIREKAIEIVKRHAELCKPRD